jgi:hypothetical protein
MQVCEQKAYVVGGGQPDLQITFEVLPSSPNRPPFSQLIVDRIANYGAGDYLTDQLGLPYRSYRVFSTQDSDGEGGGGLEEMGYKLVLL